MPRLIGKQKNSGGYIALLLLAALGTIGVMDYTGAVDIIPHFGSEYMGDPGLPAQSKQPDALEDSHLENFQGNQPTATQQTAPDQQPVAQPGIPSNGQATGQVAPQPNSQVTSPNTLPGPAY